MRDLRTAPFLFTSMFSIIGEAMGKHLSTPTLLEILRMVKVPTLPCPLSPSGPRSSVALFLGHRAHHQVPHSSEPRCPHQGGEGGSEAPQVVTCLPLHPGS